MSVRLSYSRVRSYLERKQGRGGISLVLLGDPFMDKEGSWYYKKRKKERRKERKKERKREKKKTKKNILCI